MKTTSSSAAAVTRSRSESSPITLGCLSFLPRPTARVKHNSGLSNGPGQRSITKGNAQGGTILQKCADILRPTMRKVIPSASAARESSVRETSLMVLKFNTRERSS